MAVLTWLGEDDYDGPGIPGPSYCVWKGVRFDKGNPVEVSDPDMIRRAKGNKFYSVADLELKATEVEPVKRGPGRPRKVANVENNE